MERDRAIKVGVAGVVLLFAIVLIGMNLRGHKTKVVNDTDNAVVDDTAPQGGPRTVPGG